MNKKTYKCQIVRGRRRHFRPGSREESTLAPSGEFPVEEYRSDSAAVKAATAYLERLGDTIRAIEHISYEVYVAVDKVVYVVRCSMCLSQTRKAQRTTETFENVRVKPLKLCDPAWAGP
jgi:alkylhydroperoxidase family enzyme